MDIEKQILIAKGTIKHLPGIKRLLPPPRTGGTDESRYCYSVWLRHLHHWNRFNSNIPGTVAELGPGDSFGTGFAALLSGSTRLYALDVIKYWDNARNLRIFNELVELFRKRSEIPDNSEYPRVKPALESYSFPSHVLTDELLNATLAERRVNAIRKEICNIDSSGCSFIKYKIPWHDPDVIKSNSVDLIYSQAVLECIDDLDSTYAAMCQWLKPSGMMSHTIDFKSHGLTAEWNGHWKFTDFQWELVKGEKSFLVNRVPVSGHLELLRKYGFEVLVETPVRLENRLSKDSLSVKFRELSEEDKTTSGVYIVSRKGKCGIEENS